MALFLLTGLTVGENIDPYNESSQYAWAENVGWLNFKPNQGSGVQVSGDKVEGFVWAENIGWINLSPLNYGGVINRPHIHRARQCADQQVRGEHVRSHWIGTIVIGIDAISPH